MKRSVDPFCFPYKAKLSSSVIFLSPPFLSPLVLITHLLQPHPSHQPSFKLQSPLFFPHLFLMLLLLLATDLQPAALQAKFPAAFSFPAAVLTHHFPSLFTPSHSEAGFQHWNETIALAKLSSRRTRFKINPPSVLPVPP